MGVAFVIGPCIGCRRLFWFNPLRVPSIPIDGTREPICQRCVDHINPQRKANGLPPIIPLPDAYEACDESEL